MKNIVIAGYPKSGNTWLTRLTAELLESPVAGFWRYNYKEIAMEGSKRKGAYRVFKSHHRHDELENDPRIDKIIYIIRDPRDIIVSSIHYFPLSDSQLVGRIEKIIIKRSNILLQAINSFFTIDKKRIKKMTNVIINGDPYDRNGVGKIWCREPWVNHVEPFLQSKILVVKYEDILTNPEKTCEEILAYIGLSTENKDQIKRSIENQSFDYKKNKALKESDRININFLRSGKKGKWQDIIDDTSKQEIAKSLHKTLAILNYTL